MKIGIGTAQFGMKYGLKEDNQALSLNEIGNILNYAKKNKIKLIDSAISYGNAEFKIGTFDLKDFLIVSKLPKINSNKLDNEKTIYNLINKSLNNLNIEKYYALLVHDFREILVDDKNIILKCLNELRNIGKVDKIGVSVYNPSDLEKIFNYFEPDIVQLPFNIFDRRFLDSGWISYLSSLDIEIHVRSIFLQGSLLLKDHEIPTKLKEWKNYSVQ